MSAFRNWFIDQLAMYAAYHRDGRNRATHYVGVPLIIFSVLVALVQVPLPGSFSAAGFLLGILVLGYIVALPSVGFVSAAVYVPLYLLSVVTGGLQSPPWWMTAATCFVLGWGAQFVGHVFEGRRPAFLVNILQLFMAPAFLVAEAMFVAGFQKDLSVSLALKARNYGLASARAGDDGHSAV
jgi:uncharacterized membrane protein YGL010W